MGSFSLSLFLRDARPDGATAPPGKRAPPAITAKPLRGDEGPSFASLSLCTIARHNDPMELAPRLHLMNWLTSQGLTGTPENDLVRGFCERCRAGGLDLS